MLCADRERAPRQKSDGIGVIEKRLCSSSSLSIAEIQQGAVDYAALAQVVVAAMRSPDGDPDVFIVGPALAGRGGNNAGELRKAHEYIKQLYALDALSPLFDRISLHLYTAEGRSSTDRYPHRPGAGIRGHRSLSWS